MEAECGYKGILRSCRKAEKADPSKEGIQEVQSETGPSEIYQMAMKISAEKEERHGTVMRQKRLPEGQGVCAHIGGSVPYSLWAAVPAPALSVGDEGLMINALHGLSPACL